MITLNSGSDTWTEDDDVASFRQGWQLANDKRILREPTLSIFATDQDALAFVKRRARYGDHRAKRALAFHQESLATS